MYYQWSQRGYNKTEANTIWGKKKEITVYLVYSAEKFHKTKPKITKPSNKKAFTPTPKHFQVQTPHKSEHVTSSKT